MSDARRQEKTINGCTMDIFVWGRIWLTMPHTIATEPGVLFYDRMKLSL